MIMDLEKILEKKKEDLTCEDVIAVLILLLLYENKDGMDLCRIYANILLLSDYIDLLREKCGKPTIQDFLDLIEVCKNKIEKEKRLK